MIQPFALDLLEQFDCSFEPFAAAPEEIRQGFDDFVNRRSANIAVAPQGHYESQRDYFAGRFPDGSAARYPQATTNDAPPAGCPAAASTSARSDAAVARDDRTARHRTGFDLKPFSG
jgi:hypothetical protein